MSHFIFLISTYYEMQGLQLNFGEFQNLFGRTFFNFFYLAQSQARHSHICYVFKKIFVTYKRDDSMADIDKFIFES